ncbi:MAG: hypothetical protein MJY84_01650, partial [Bacteroidales bacterium]|nr:hypothetical protein [Bacteroidales bacterium]
DTTLLSIQQTTPLNDSRHPRSTAGESVEVSVNGSPVNLTKLSDASQTTGPQYYMLKRNFSIGDKVEVRGSVPGAKPVESSFTVPGAFPEHSVKVRVEGLEEYYSQICFDVEYENTPESSGCYGMAVLKETTYKSMHGLADAFTQTISWGDTSIFVGTGYEYPESIGDLGITSSGQEPMVFYSDALDEIFGRRERPSILAWADAADSRIRSGSITKKNGRSGRCRRTGILKPKAAPTAAGNSRSGQPPIATNLFSTASPKNCTTTSRRTSTWPTTNCPKSVSVRPHSLTPTSKTA